MKIVATLFVDSVGKTTVLTSRSATGFGVKTNPVIAVAVDHAGEASAHFIQVINSVGRRDSITRKICGRGIHRQTELHRFSTRRPWQLGPAADSAGGNANGKSSEAPRDSRSSASTVDVSHR